MSIGGECRKTFIFRPNRRLNFSSLDWEKREDGREAGGFASEIGPSRTLCEAEEDGDLLNSSRRKLLDRPEAPFALHGMNTRSIREAPVPIRLNGRNAGAFQALEIFEPVAGLSAFPQTVADIVSNTYFRLVYQKRDGTSATFGTSVVGSPSYRDEKGRLHFVPTVMAAEARMGGPERLSVRVTASHGTVAAVQSIRRYDVPSVCSETTMTLEVKLKALRDLELSATLLGRDAFRLLTISSMFAGEQRYDANAVSWRGDRGDGTLLLHDGIERGGYLFAERVPCRELALLKDQFSQGAQNTPGSPDSPSLRVKILACSLPAASIGIQGYLVPSRDPNDDSVTVWLEWLDCPARVAAGTMIAATFSVSASPPG